METVGSTMVSSHALPDKLFDAYRALEREGIVESDELTMLEAWLEAIA
jgi:hypothetical protein